MDTESSGCPLNSQYVQEIREISHVLVFVLIIFQARVEKLTITDIYFPGTLQELTRRRDGQACPGGS